MTATGSTPNTYLSNDALQNRNKTCLKAWLPCLKIWTSVPFKKSFQFLQISNRSFSAASKKKRQQNGSAKKLCHFGVKGIQPSNHSWHHRTPKPRPWLQSWAWSRYRSSMSYGILNLILSKHVTPKPPAMLVEVAWNRWVAGPGCPDENSGATRATQ